MSTSLPVLSGRQVAKVLAKAGFVHIPDRGKGSHLFMFRADPRTALTIPDHREVKRGTLRAIIRKAGLSVDDFVALL